MPAFAPPSHPISLPRPPSRLADGSGFELEEFCGLTHGPQVVELEGAGDSAQAFFLKNSDGRLFPAQRSFVHPDRIFVQVSLQPFEKLLLAPAPDPAAPTKSGVSFREDASGIGIIQAEHFSLEVPLGHDTTIRSGLATPGPIKRVRCGAEGAWRGRSFFDLREPVQMSRGEILEEGPVRIVFRYRVETVSGGFYEATVTVDAGLPFAKIEEEFRSGAGDQLVWDFAGEDRPSELLALDSGSAYGRRILSYHFDRRLARLAAWTQQSQHLDLVDGFAVPFSDDGVLGFVTLEGGAWRGDKLNHLEAWVRRWLPNDPASRRDVPADAKADSYPSPERVPARGGVVCEEHCNIEGWIGQGRRIFALAPTTRKAIEPLAAPNEEPLGHFEDVPDRPRYRRLQSGLRRIQIQHGVLSLQTLLAVDFSWPHEPPPSADVQNFAFPNEVLDQHFKQPTLDSATLAKDMQAYLAARVYGFWEGAGIAYSNPVVSRRIAPEMFRYEWLVRQGTLGEDQQKILRAHFAFLLSLFSSENYYTGDRAMLPAESPDSTEPTLAGMANQNFYTDVINVFGTGAQIFHQHPQAAVWRERFIQQWHRQLAFHMYPESGVWEESHTYYQHVMHTVLPTLLRRRADGVDNEFANPTMQKLAASALKQITPRDATMGGLRYLIALGDHGRCPHPALFAALARAFRGTNDDLAGQLAWLAREMGAPIDESLPGIAPSWSNEAVQGLGVMFRGVERSGQESLLAFRSGNAWGHHHNDDGSIQFYAGGQCLIGDSAFGENQADGKKFSASGHSRWSLRDAQPVNHYWRFNRGWITQVELGGRFPRASGTSPVYTIRGGLAETEILTNPVSHTRSVVQLDATTYVVLDASRSAYPQVVRFHLTGSSAVLDGNRVMLDFPGGWLQLIPLFSSAEFPVTLRLSDSAGEKNTTTEVAYEMGREGSAAFLLHAGPAGEKFSVTSSGDLSTIRTAEWDVEIQRLASGELAVADLKSGQKTTLPISR